MTRRELLALAAAAPLAAQDVYDLLLKGAHVIDPKNRRNGVMDIAIGGGKIRKIGSAIPAAHARRVVELGGFYVTPGLIDISGNFGSSGGVNPDHNSLRAGVTTVVDSVSVNAGSLAAFQRDVAAHAKTRVLAYWNGPNPPAARGKQTDIVIDVPAPRSFADAKGGELREGEILTHIYGPTPLPASARRKGVTLDVGHGASSFYFRTAVPAIRAGLLPDTISTAMDRKSLLLPRANMTNVLSKFLAMGLTLDQVIERSTVNAARAIRRPDLGSLEEGAPADIAALELRTGEFGLLDSGHAKLTANKELRCILTVRNGAVAWDSEGLSLTHWRDAGPYSNFK